MYEKDCLKDLVDASTKIIVELKSLEAMLNNPDKYPAVKEMNEQGAWNFMENNTAILRLCEMITRSNLYLRA